MTQISAKVIADSKNEFGNRITTMIVTFPRIILAEFNTHRMFSRNSASSRAIPFEKMVKSVEENPFIPIAWQKDHKGMQGTEYFTFDLTCKQLEKQWLEARDNAVRSAKNLAMGDGYEGLTKQLCNRLLEPFMWHTVIVTATEWENFFALRCPQYGGFDAKQNEVYFRSKKDALKHLNSIGVHTHNLSLNDILGWLAINKGQAEIHMMALAEAMWDAYNESTPKELKAGEWHIPFGDNINDIKLDNTLKDIYDIRKDDLWNLSDAKIKIATARCARVSYTVVGEEGKEPNYEKDIELHDRLLVSGHMSPMEHCAKAMSEQEYELSVNGKLEWTGGQYDKPLPTKGSEGWSGNFKGFVQYRKMLPNENKI